MAMLTPLSVAPNSDRPTVKGRVVVDPATHRTGNAKVWSGGDCVNGGKEVVNAAAEARVAVRDIQRALSSRTSA